MSTAAEPSSAGPALTTTWRVQNGVFRFTFRRTVTLLGSDRLAVELSVVNTGGAPLPGFWSSHDMLPLTEHTRIALPPGTLIRLFSAHGFAPALGEHRWPDLGLADGTRS